MIKAKIVVEINGPLHCIVAERLNVIIQGVCLN